MRLPECFDHYSLGVLWFQALFDKLDVLLSHAPQNGQATLTTVAKELLATVLCLIQDRLDLCMENRQRNHNLSVD